MALNDTVASATAQQAHNSLAMDSAQASSNSIIPENINNNNNNSNNSDGILHSGGGCLSLSNDARLEFITSYTLTSLRLKHDKWHKMMANQEYQLILLDWLNNPHRRLLVMTLNPAGHLIPKNSINDLYQHNYAILLPKITTTMISNMDTLKIPATTKMEETRDSIEVSLAPITSRAVVPAIATAAMTAVTALLAPLPPPCSSFSALDGVPRGKCAYFLKRQLNTTLTRDNFRSEIICGDFPIHSKIETLSILFDEILQPIIQNPLNRTKWPEVVAKDINARLKEVRNTVTEIKGKTNNRTILSLLVSPAAVEQVASHVKQGNLEPALEPKFLSQLEEMFITWTTQIHELIQEKSDCVISSAISSAKAAKNFIVAVYTPQQEINFWINRQQNLQNIYDQLRTDTHKSLAFILEAIDSSYYPSFMKIFKNLIFAWQEAKDISLWLQPLLRQMAAFNAVNFSNAQEMIGPLVHIIHLIWSNARYYRTTQHMTVLLRCICNAMVRRAGEDLEISTLFQTDVDEGLLKISRTVDVLQMFKSKLLEYKTKYTSNQTILPALPNPIRVSSSEASAVASTSVGLQQLWRFCNDDIFGATFDDFMEQLTDLQAIFEAADTFQSLEKLEIGGGRGKALTERLRQIHGEFKLLFEELTKLEIDFGQQQQANVNTSVNCSRVKRQTFKREQIFFFQRMKVLEQKLATILQQAYNDCHNWEQLTKLTTMFANIVQRQTIQTELLVILPHIFSVLRKELLLIETIVSEVLLAFEYKGVEAIPMEMNFPTIAGAMMWLENHMKRCDVFAGNELNAVITTLLTDDNPLSFQYEKLIARRDILTTKLSNLQLRIWNNWQQAVEKRTAKGLDSKVMLLLTMIPQQQQHQQQQQQQSSPKCMNCHDAEQNHVFCSETNKTATNTNNKAKSTWLAKNETNFHTNKPDVVYCHPLCQTLGDEMVDSKAGLKLKFLSVSNDELTLSENRCESLTKSSFVSGLKILEINLSLELFALLRETKYLLALQETHRMQKQGESTATTHDFTTQLALKTMQQQQQRQRQQEYQQHDSHQLPLTLLHLYAQRDTFWQRKIKLMKIAEYYNSIREGLNASNEMKLIQPVVDAIDERVECASKTLTWRLYDSQLIDEIFEKTQTLHSRLHQSRQNIQTVLESLRKWSREPLHQRSPYGKNLLELNSQKERLRLRVLQCEETKLLLNRLLIENFYLFFDCEKREKDIQDKTILEFLSHFPESQRSKYTSYLKSIDNLINEEVICSTKIR